jgi:ribosomal protein L7Ae-like RNA K-turn-binding protein
VDADTTRKLFGLLGLGVRGRGAIIGVEQVKEAARRGKLVLAIAAPDASSNSLNKVLPLLKAKEIPVFSAPSAKELGNAVGRDSTTVVGIVDRGLAKGIRALSLSAMTVGSKEELG